MPTQEKVKAMLGAIEGVRPHKATIWSTARVLRDLLADDADPSNTRYNILADDEREALRTIMGEKACQD